MDTLKFLLALAGSEPFFAGEIGGAGIAAEDLAHAGLKADVPGRVLHVEFDLVQRLVSRKFNHELKKNAALESAPGVSGNKVFDLKIQGLATLGLFNGQEVLVVLHQALVGLGKSLKFVRVELTIFVQVDVVPHHQGVLGVHLPTDMKACELACGVEQRVELVGQAQMRMCMGQADTEKHGDEGCDDKSSDANHEFSLLRKD